MLQQDVVENHDGAWQAVHVDALMGCGDDAERQAAATLQVFEAQDGVRPFVAIAILVPADGLLVRAPPHEGRTRAVSR